MYTSEGTTLLRLKDGAFEVRKTLSRGQWGATQDDAGRVYRNTNSAALFVDIVPTPYYTRNPRMMRTRGSYETLDTGDLNTVWPIRPTPGVNRGYQDGVLRPDKTLAAFTAVGAPTFYRGDRLPAELYGNVFLAEPAGNLVSRIIVTDDGTMLRGKKAYERGEFIASTDERFRPVNLSSAPDGTLYVVDMYHGIIQHKGYITEYLRDQILSRKLERPQGHGRIYRVVHTTTKRGPKPALSAMKGPQLVELLAHPNGWWRDTAQQLIVERGDRSAIPALKEKAERAPDWRTRLHAMWTLDGIDAVEPATGHESARRFVAGCAGIGGSDCRALAERREAPDPGGGVEENRRQGLGGAPSACGKPGRVAGWPRRSRRSRPCSSGTETIRSRSMPRSAD